MEADPRLPGADVLLGGEAVEVLAVAVEGAGGTLLTARPSQVRYHPGRRLIVRYGAEIRWGDGSQRVETLGAMVQRRPLPDTVSVIEGEDGSRIGVWRYPHDPFLPGLPAAAYPDGARAVLARLGIATAQVRVEPMVYRPGSRAVLRVTGDNRVVYLKVVRRGRAARLHAIHDAFGAATRVPRCLASSDPLGLIVLEALPGRPLTSALVDGGSVPAPESVAELALRFREVQLPDVEGKHSRPAPVRDHVAALSAALPAERGRLERLAARSMDLGDPVEQTVHGDFYEAQLLIAPDGSISGVLDIDGAAGGSASDDPATLIGHLVGLAHVHPAAAERIDAYRLAVDSAFTQAVNSERLHATVTGVLLGLATTPFRRQDPGWTQGVQGWLDVAEAWTDGHLRARD